MIKGTKKWLMYKLSASRVDCLFNSDLLELLFKEEFLIISQQP